MNATQPLEILSILRDAVAAAASHAAEGVIVDRSQSAIRFRIDRADQRAEMLALKGKVAVYLQEKYPHRVFRHDFVRGHKVWHIISDYTHRSEGLACGIRVERLEEETRSICLGPVRGVNCG